MPPRAKNSVDMMIAQAQEKMRELKELQFFGGDALNLKRWSQVINIPPDATAHLYSVVMTPDDPETTMPFNALLRPASATSYMTGQIEPVHRTDNAFEYLVMTETNYDVVSRPTKLTIEYSGKATFNFTQLA